MIKRYSAADIAFQCEHSTEADNPKWCRYADIAPLEAKAAMFDEMLAELSLLNESIPLTDQCYDLLTRARAMESTND